MKQLTCLLQGISDVPLEDLGGMTPFMKSHHTHFDQLEKEGGFYTVPIPHHVIFGPSCERSLLALLGFDVENEEVSKGPLEAYMLGYALAPHQKAFSMRFMSVGQETIVDVSDDLVTDNENQLLCRALNQSFKREGLFFFPLSSSQAVLLTTHPALCALSHQRTLSPVELIGRQWQKLLQGEGHDVSLAKPCVELLRRVQQVLIAQEINALREELEEQPINAIWLSDQGSRPKWAEISNQQKAYFQRKLLIAYTPSFLGVARMLGIQTIQLSRETKKYESLSLILSQLDSLFIEKDALLIELPYLWGSTYKGDLLEKIKTIEWLDRHWVAPLVHFSRERNIELVFRPLTNTDIREGKLASGDVPLWSQSF